YNIILNPLFRGQGIGSQAIAEVFGNENAMFLKKTYSQIKVYTLPENQAMKKILLSQGFSAPTQDGDFLFYKKDLTKNNINEQGK
ncbi:MAG: GNAT family N-acetyltransferase, partial [Eubacteriales bacterium]|nr:GNAT family N-acetyltransferase [Eubacteriales bacterium]